MLGIFFMIFITEIILLFTVLNIIKIIRYKKILKNLDKEFNNLQIDLNEEFKNSEIESNKEMQEMIDIINKYKEEK